jgi:predicted Zn-dependent protease
MQAAAIVEEVFAENPRHPGALHYLIHCYDDPVHAPLGLRAASIYANVAPEAAHALHMPSHIFVALGMWDEYVKANQDSWAASEARVRRKSLGLEHRGYHALWWLEYGYLQQGRLRDARRLLEIIAADAARSAAPIVHSHLAQMRAHYAIETGMPAPGQAPSADHLDPAAAAGHTFAQALLAIRGGKRDEAGKLLEALRTPRPNHTPASHREGGHAPDIAAIEIMEKEIEGLLLLDAGKNAEAVEALQQAAEREDRMSFEFGPPAPPKPAHELFGEVLLALGHAPQAQAQFQLALRRAPKRALSLLGLGRAAAKAGDAETSREAYAELRRIRARAD